MTHPHTKHPDNDLIGEAYARAKSLGMTGNPDAALLRRLGAALRKLQPFVSSDPMERMLASTARRREDENHDRVDEQDCRASD